MKENVSRSGDQNSDHVVYIFAFFPQKAYRYVHILYHHHRRRRRRRRRRHQHNGKKGALTLFQLSSSAFDRAHSTSVRLTLFKE